MTPEMIDLARANALKSGLMNIEYHLAAIDKLQLSDATVDCVISNCVINLAPDKPAVFREIARMSWSVADAHSLKRQQFPAT